MKLTTTLALVCGLAILAGLGWTQDEESDLRAKAKEIEALLIAPCCWRAPIADHQSAIATQMKEEVRQMLEEGAEPQEILDHYVEQYGVRILAMPPQEGFNRMSVLMPIVFVVFGIGIIGILLQRWHRHSLDESSGQTKGSETGGPAVVSDEVSRRIQKELDEMD